MASFILGKGSQFSANLEIAYQTSPFKGWHASYYFDSDNYSPNLGEGKGKMLYYPLDNVHPDKDFVINTAESHWSATVKVFMLVKYGEAYLKPGNFVLISNGTDQRGDLCKIVGVDAEIPFLVEVKTPDGLGVVFKVSEIEPVSSNFVQQKISMLREVYLNSYGLSEDFSKALIHEINWLGGRV